MLKEAVIVTTAWGGQTYEGELRVGKYGLPGLTIPAINHRLWLPWEVPAAWSLKYVLDLNVEPVLYPAWQAIERIQRQIAVAQREAEQEMNMSITDTVEVERTHDKEERREQARQREIDNRIAMELDNGKTD